MSRPEKKLCHVDKMVSLKTHYLGLWLSLVETVSGSKESESSRLLNHVMSVTLTRNRDRALWGIRFSEKTSVDTASKETWLTLFVLHMVNWVFAHTLCKRTGLYRRNI